MYYEPATNHHPTCFEINSGKLFEHCSSGIPPPRLYFGISDFPSKQLFAENGMK